MAWKVVFVVDTHPDQIADGNLSAVEQWASACQDEPTNLVTVKSVHVTKA